MAALAAVAWQPAGAAALRCSTSDAVCHALQQEQGTAASNQAQLGHIRDQIASTDAKMAALETLITALDARVAAEAKAVIATQGRLAVLSAQIAFATRQLDQREAELSYREQLFAARVRELAKQTSVDYLGLVLSSSSFSQLIDRLTEAAAIIRADHAFVEDLRLERDQVQALKASLESRRLEQAQLLAREEELAAQLVADRSSQQAALAYQEQVAGELAAERAVLERQQALIHWRIRQLQAEYAAEARRAGGGRGQFMWPEAGNPPISQGFGCTDLLSEPYSAGCATLHFHTGIDIAGAYGSPIYAADTGVASAFWGWGGGYGNFIIITHGNGYASLYGHLSAIVVRSSQLVGRGQLIGYEGSSGFSTGPHLHFEIRYYGNYENPCLYLGC